MHIAFVSLGAFGHINPTLALVTELVKKGVRVTYFTTEAFRTIIEPTGAKFVAVPSWMAENDKHNEDGEKKEDDGGVAAAVPFLFLNEAGAYIDTVLDTLKNAEKYVSNYHKAVAHAEEMAKKYECPFVDNEMPYGRVPQGHPVIVDYFYHEEIRGTENTGKRNR